MFGSEKMQVEYFVPKKFAQQPLQDFDQKRDYQQNGMLPKRPRPSGHESLHHGLHADQSQPIRQVPYNRPVQIDVAQCYVGGGQGFIGTNGLLRQLVGSTESAAALTPLKG